MPKPKSKLRGKPSKPPKPPAAVFPLIESLQLLVEDHSRWASSPHQSIAQLHTSLSNLRTLQADSLYYPSLIPNRTQDSFDTFITWLRQHGLDTSTCPFRVSFLPGQSHDNATLFATRHIPADEVVIRVAEALILSLDQSTQSPMHALLTEAPAIASMSSLALVLQILLEAANPESRFAPYISILPASFTIPLGNFSPQDYAALAPSRAAEAAINTLRATVRDYTHVYTLLHRKKIHGMPVSLLSLDNYFWATSVAMTRQNEIPSGTTGKCALVPIWDMCNHSPGPTTTAVGVDEDGDVIVESKAMRDFEEGEPITICYGRRPNTELLLYSGFVQSDNENDKVPLDLLLETRADLAKFKAKVVLAKARIVVEELENGRGWIVPLSIDTSSDSADRALAVARVMAAGKDTIGELLKSGEGLPRSPLQDEIEEQAAKHIVMKALTGALSEYEAAEECRPETLSPLAAELVAKLHDEERKMYQNVLKSLDLSLKT